MKIKSFSCALRENAENMYYFSSLALTLNEEEEGVCLTDSRLRPDQRLMEAGRWDEANAEKQRLEEKQRATRRRREADVSMAIDEGEQTEKMRAETSELESSFRLTPTPLTTKFHFSRNVIHCCFAFQDGNLKATVRCGSTRGWMKGQET